MKKIILLIIPLVCFSKNLSLESRTNPPARELMDVEIFGDIMIIPGNLDGYDFFDISTPSGPVHISNIEVPMGNRILPGFWVEAKDSIAYFTSRTKGDRSAIVDFSNPYNPVHIGSLPTPIENISYEGSDIFGDYLAVACHEDGVFFFDISDPLNLEIVYDIPTQNAWSVAFIDSSSIAIADGQNVILTEYNCLLDSCDESIINTNGIVKDLQVFNDLLYIAEGSHGVSLYHISDISNPVFLDQYDSPGLSNKIALFDSNKVAVSDWLDVKVLEWTGDSLQLVGYKNTGKRTMSIATNNQFIYSAEWQHLQTFSFGEIEDQDLDINSWDITYPSLNIGESDTFDFIVENNGQFPLGFTLPTFSHSDFTIDNFPEYLDAGTTVTSHLIYSRSEQNASGVMQISSNDPDEPLVEVQLVGNYEGGIVGVEAPDFTLPIVANGSGDFNLSNHQGKIVVIAFFAPG